MSKVYKPEFTQAQFGIVYQCLLNRIEEEQEHAGGRVRNVHLLERALDRLDKSAAGL